jgi:hypothetical protein
MSFKRDKIFIEHTREAAYDFALAISEFQHSQDNWLQVPSDEDAKKQAYAAWKRLVDAREAMVNATRGAARKAPKR